MFITMAVFQAWGSLSVVYDSWKMCCILGDISLAVSFSIFAGISSGPFAYLGFRTSSGFMIFLVRFLWFELREMVIGFLLG